MTGMNVRSKDLVQNRNLKSQISSWLSFGGSVPGESTSASVVVDTNRTAAAANSELNEADVLVTLNIIISSSTSTAGVAANNFQVKLQSSSTVSDLRRAIVRVTKGAHFPHHITYNGQRLNNERSLSSYRIHNKDTVLARTEISNSVTLTLDFTTRKVSILASSTDTIASIHWRLWRDNNLQPSKITLWTGLSVTGDGQRSGHILRSHEIVGNKIKRTEDGECIEIVVLGCHAHLKEKYKSKKMTRLQVAAQLFHAFTNRTEVSLFFIF